MVKIGIMANLYIKYNKIEGLHHRTVLSTCNDFPFDVFTKLIIELMRADIYPSLKAYHLLEIKM